MALAYLGLGLLGCRPGWPVLLPSGLQPVEEAQVAAWVEETRPTTGKLYRFKWQYEDEQAAKGGRGSLRFAPPDTLRLDFMGSLGIGKGSALVVGDSSRWVVPERSIEELIPNIALLWAMSGIARTPSSDTRLTALVGEGRVAWRYVAAGDTTDYLRAVGTGTALTTEIRRDGRIVGRAVWTGASDGTPATARLDMPTVPAKLEITFYATASTATFPPETWAPPQP